MFKNLFKKSKDNNVLIEPVFPGEHFSIFKLDIDDGLAFGTINTAYNNYPNKASFPWCAQITIELYDKNDNGHPTNPEAEVLNDLEDKITRFLKETQTVHAVGRVTRNGERDIIYYIDEPKLNKKKVQPFFDSINIVRPMNFVLEKDEKWVFVNSFIQ